MSKKTQVALLALSLAAVSSTYAEAQPKKDGKVVDGEYFPGPSELTFAASQCGLSVDDYSLTTDEEGVANIDVRQGSMSASEYGPKADCFLSWAAENNAAAGVEGPKED